ncbi:MAG: alcohol dehydrogenase, partial [Kiritimatiellae bacterium]|nr:alcohol dehydrogenase [Kiritimatiellia bacterium]
MESIGLCRPRGTLVLKSTVATQGSVNLAPIVVNELTVVGSRCGRFERGLEIMESDHLPVEQLIAARYPLADGIKGFEHASRRGALKVLITVSS